MGFSIPSFTLYSVVVCFLLNRKLHFHNYQHLCLCLCVCVCVNAQSFHFHFVYCLFMDYSITKVCDSVHTHLYVGGMHFKGMKQITSIFSMMILPELYLLHYYKYSCSRDKYFQYVQMCWLLY